MLRLRIQRRGRGYEQEIPDEYLERLNRLYEDFAASYHHSPLLPLDGDMLDFVADPEGFGWVCRQIEARGLREPMLR